MCRRPHFFERALSAFVNEEVWRGKTRHGFSFDGRADCRTGDT